MMLHLVLGLLSALFLQGDAVPLIPHLKDETPILRVKANPRQFLGEPVIFCGGIGVSDYYNFGYRDSSSTHYSLVFREVGKVRSDLSLDFLYLYLEKNAKTAPIMEAIVSRLEKQGATQELLLVRVRASLNPARYFDGENWSLMDLSDVQFYDDDKKAWKPWYFERERTAAEAAKKKEKDLIAATQKRVEEERLASLKAETDLAAEFEKKQWRQWTLKDGTKIEARYGGIVSGELKLITRKDEAHKIPTGDLTPEEKQWIKEKPWINTDAAKPKKPSSRKPQTKRDKFNTD